MPARVLFRVFLSLSLVCGLVFLFLALMVILGASCFVILFGSFGLMFMVVLGLLVSAS